MKRANYVILVALLLGSPLLPSALHAQEKKETQQKPKAPAGLTPDQISKLPEPDVNKAGDKSKILIDKIEVLGTLAKPQALFIIPGSDPQVDGLTIDRSFFLEIFRPVEKDFFPQRGRRKMRKTIPW